MSHLTLRRETSKSVHTVSSTWFFCRFMCWICNKDRSFVLRQCLKCITTITVKCRWKILWCQYSASAQQNLWRKIRVILHACLIYSKCTNKVFHLRGYVLDIFCCCVNCTVSMSALSAFLRWLGWWVWVWRKTGTPQIWYSYPSTLHILKRISFLPQVFTVCTPQNNPSDFLRPLLCVG